MTKVFEVILLSIVFVPCGAQNAGVVKLQCEGTYTDYSSPDMRDVPLKGIYLEISDKSVKIVGTAGFDATYSVFLRRENGIGIQLDSNKSYAGFLNRFSGVLSLSEKGNVAEDGSFKVKQSIAAACTTARPLF